MKTDFDWREIVPVEIQDRLTVGSVEIMDELQNHHDIPLPGPGEDWKAQMANWFITALQLKRLTLDELNHLRVKLHLHQDLPHVMAATG